MTIFDFFSYSAVTLFYIFLAVFSFFTFKNSKSGITDVIPCLITACFDFYMCFVNGYCFIVSFSSFVGSITVGSVGSDVILVSLFSKWSLRPAASTVKRKQFWKKI